MRIIKICTLAALSCFFTAILYAAPVVWHFDQKLERIENGRYIIDGIAYVLSPKIQVFIAPKGNLAESNLKRTTIDAVSTGDMVTIQEHGASILVITILR